MYSEKVMEHFANPRNVGEIENPSGVGTVGNPVCTMPESLIHTNSRVSQIKDLKEGARVLSHDGKYHAIEKVYSRDYEGTMYSLRVHNLGEIEVTPEHLLLALKIGQFPHKFKAAKKSLPDWYSPQELEEGDFLLFPIPKETIDLESISLSEAKPKWDFKSRELPNEVRVDDDFLRLVGFYLAEGYVRTDRCKGTVGFVFGSKEEGFAGEIVSLMKRVFHIPPGKIERKNNSISVPFYSARLARFFEKNFGKGAAEKKLPHWAILLPPDQQRHLIYGFWHGDGCVGKDTAKFVTISRQLAYQVVLLLLRQRIILSFLTFPSKGIHKRHYAIFVKNYESLSKLANILGVDIPFFAKKKNPKKSWFDEDYYYTPIWKIDSHEYEGKVYNLKVEEPHSYVSNAAVLHNCGDVMKLFIKVEDGVITDAKFKTFGCGAAIATSSMVTELIKGKTVEEALKISNRAVAEALGGLPPVKMHCSVLAEDALKGAIEDYLKKTKGSVPGEIKTSEVEKKESK